jgi:hypothetical protein
VPRIIIAAGRPPASFYRAARSLSSYPSTSTRCCCPSPEKRYPLAVLCNCSQDGGSPFLEIMPITRTAPPPAQACCRPTSHCRCLRRSGAPALLAPTLSPTLFLGMFLSSPRGINWHKQRSTISYSRPSLKPTRGPTQGPISTLPTSTRRAHISTNSAAIDIDEASCALLVRPLQASSRCGGPNSRLPPPATPTPLKFFTNALAARGRPRQRECAQRSTARNASQPGGHQLTIPDSINGSAYS